MEKGDGTGRRGVYSCVMMNSSFDSFIPDTVAQDFDQNYLRLWILDLGSRILDLGSHISNHGGFTPM